MTDSNLKPGWRRVKFGDVVQLSKARSSDPLKEGFERYVGLEHLEPGDLRIRSWGNVAHGVTFTNVFKPGQVLFGKRRAYQRKVAMADFAGVCSGDIYVMESKDSSVLLPEMLPFICQTNEFFEHAVGTSAGSLSPRTNWNSLESYCFNLPAPMEQVKLVAKLSAEIEVNQAYESALAVLYKMRKAHLMDTFRLERGSSDHFPEHWEVKCVGEAGNVQLGQKRQPGVHKGDNMRPYLRVANVFDGYFKLDDVMSMHFAERDIKKYELLSGDILLNEGQSQDLVGRSAIYEGQIPGACFQMTLLRFRCNENLRPKFAHAFFQHCLYTGQFAARCMKTTSIAHLSAAGLASMKMPIPPLEEQLLFEERLNQIDFAIKALLARHAAFAPVSAAKAGMNGLF